jgi:hypothetical protein
VFVDYASDGMYVQEEESDDNVGGLGGGGQSEVKEDINITQGLDVRQTIHQADMYRQDISDPGFREVVSEWADMNKSDDGVRLPSFDLRLQTLGCKTDGASPVRVVMFTSPPFGWNLSPYDALPANEKEKEVREIREISDSLIIRLIILTAHLTRTYNPHISSAHTI